MADFTALKTAIQNAIKQNGNNAITGNLLQDILISMVSTLGDSAINGLVSSLGTETTNRQNADGTLQSAINTINTKLADGYVYVGIATAITNPGTLTGKVFYIATTAGTYTNFRNSSSQPLVLTQGINILKYNGTSWSVEQVWGVDDVPTAVSNNLVKSGGVQNELALGAVYDVSAKNPTAGPNNDGKWESLSALLSDANLNTLIPISVRKGGMSVKYVCSSDNKYAQARCMAQNFTTDVSQWQGVDAEPTAYSQNLVKSGGVKEYAVEKKIGVNLLDPNAASLNKFINTDGSITDSDNYNSSDYIPVEQGETYACSVYQVQFWRVIFYDSTRTFLGSETSLSEVQTFTAPSNAAFVRVTIRKDKWDYAEVAKSSARVTYEPYSPIAGYEAIPLRKSVNDDKLNSVTVNTLDEQSVGLGVKKSKNMFNAETMTVSGKYISNAGNISNNADWAMTDYIPVVAGHYYYITAKTIGRTTGLLWFNSSKTKIGGGNIAIYNNKLTAPENAAYIAFNLKANNVSSTYVMLAESEIAVPYESFYVIPEESVEGLQEKLNALNQEVDSIQLQLPSKSLMLTKNGRQYTISNNVGSIVLKTRTMSNSKNPIINFETWTYGNDSGVNGDDVAPAHILNMTIGANHALLCAKVTLSSHGFDNTIIGTEWLHSNGKKYYPALIVDSNNIIFISQNDGTTPSPAFTVMPAGTLTYNGNSYTVSTVSTQQLYPSVANHTFKIVVDENTIDTDGSYDCTECQLIETYDIVNPASVLTNLIARAGQSTEPSFDGEHVATVENTYRFDKSLNVVVLSNFVVKEEIAFLNLMFTQAARIGENGVTKYYIPNSLPWGTVDLRKPSAITWSAGLPTIQTSSAYTKDTTKPINRVIQYLTETGFALGYVPNLGLSVDLSDYTNATFEIRNDTGKVYPHGVDSNKQGDTLHAGDMFSAAMYRCFFSVPSAGNRQSMYHFELDGSEYVFVDYSGSLMDKVVIDDSLNGRKITVIEASNAVLKTSIYNGGFYIDADYVENETCYMIVKIV